ncbi:MAG: STAS domain-containing protein [Vampirovibrionales bacterium]|nr:STAS domain-containing protein [Vampirovibrionales bacterium]
MTPITGLKTREAGDATVVEIDSQNVDFRNCETIKAAIQSIVRSGRNRLILNLGKVGFMDSSGLSILLSCKRLCEETNGRLTLCALQSYVSNLVMLTNLNRSIPIFETEEQAIAG